MKELRTRWSGQADSSHVLEEYPRPLMARESYVNLNGLWDYAICSTKEEPEEFDGKILVPFSPEAPLSGVRRQLQPSEYLWYRRTLPEEIKAEKERRVLLHFGAVDQYAVVWINDIIVKKHLGGYLPFEADITDYLHDGENVLKVRVQDYSDTSYYSRGKQKLKRGGMFYTAQSGIWQTVWLEMVPERYITEIKTEPLYDEQMLRIMIKENRMTEKNGEEDSEEVRITVSGEGIPPAEARGRAGEPVEIFLPDMHSWSPEDPYLYSIEAALGEDKVTSYAAMRKISVEKDEKGIPRLFLNNKPYFQKGLLDQGYWPDGLYTPPCDEAMLYDIRLAKRLGFNMLRKHIKIEPQRWYYHCDREGMLVWQDMVCGGRAYKSWYVTYLATAMEFLQIRLPDNTLGLLGRKDEKGRRQFVEEMKETISRLYNHPSIVVWVLFNEGWGQFYANEVTKLAREEDPRRMIDQASGWYDQGGGDIRSIHNYFFPLKIKPETKRAAALTEFGGYAWSVKGHCMCGGEYGYRKYKDKKSLTEGYSALLEEVIIPGIDKGLSASIYTQLSDIEEEVNGIVTYDREVIKLDETSVRRLNDALTLSADTE